MPMPSNAPYKVLRFARGRIPEGLRTQHNLKAGVRAELEVIEGGVVYVDSEGRQTTLKEGDVIDVPPQAPHHLENAEDAAIELRLFRVET